MNKKEILLVKLIEECAEVSKVATKYLRFGAESIGPKEIKSNRDLLEEELMDIWAIWQYIIEEGMVDEPGDSMDYRLEGRIERIEKYLEVSKQLGTLTE